MKIRQELPGDRAAIHATHLAAFDRHQAESGTPPEPALVDELRTSREWLPQLSLVALHAGDVIGHVVCSRGWIDGEHPALGLGPLGVLPHHQGRGAGTALMHAVLGAASALGESVVVLLGHLDYYPRFGFEPASEHGILAPVDDWQSHLQVRVLSPAPAPRGTFRYAPAFDNFGG